MGSRAKKKFMFGARLAFSYCKIVIDQLKAKAEPELFPDIQCRWSPVLVDPEGPAWDGGLSLPPD